MSLIAQKRLAELLGINTVVIRDAIKEGKLLKDIDGGIKLDCGHTQAFMMSHHENTEDKKEEGLQTAKLRAEVGKLQADEQLKNLKIDEQKGLLIEKERVAGVLFSYLDALNVNILDSPESMIDHIIDKVKAGAKRGEIISYMRGSLGRQIKNTKTQIQKRLK